MQITREDLNPCTVQLQIVCEPEEVREGFEKAFKKVTKKMKLPGFRPGHVPKSILEQYVDKSDLYDQAAEEIVNRTFRKALEEQKLEVDASTRPFVDLKKLNDEESACEYLVKVPLPPIVELGEIEKLPVEKPTTEVSAEEIEYHLNEMRKHRGTRESVTTRGVQEGDAAVVNIRVDGDEGEGRTFMTMVGQTFPQLDQALMGMKAEDTKSATVTFPENFQEKDWAGKPLKVKITLNSLTAVNLPELDDEFAKTMKADNLDELRTKLAEQIQAAKEEMIREIVGEQLFEQLLQRSKVEVSDPMWEGIAERRLQETAEEQKQQGKTLEEYAEANGLTIDSLREEWRAKAKEHVQRALLVREVFSSQQMKLAERELSRELLQMAQEFRVSPEEMLDVLKKNNAVQELHFRAMTRMVSELLLEKAEVKEVAVPAGA